MKSEHRFQKPRCTALLRRLCTAYGVMHTALLAPCASRFLESVSISQKLRKILDAPFARKGIVFWVFSPVLFLILFVVSCIARLRRRKGYARFPSMFPDNLQVICIGNILIGGTGKSPLVRVYAKEYLQNDVTVAIVARGIGSRGRDAPHVVVDSLNFKKEEIDKLSDENREHFEILRSAFPEKQFFIFQNKNRFWSLNEFVKIVSKTPAQKFVFILDDGLQHFSCPRHINICVCDEQLNQNAPPYAFPVGPYREGFGRKSVQKLLEAFDIRIWTNGVILDPAVKPRDDNAVPRPNAVIPRPSAVIPRPSAVIPRLDTVIPRPSAVIPRPSAVIPRLDTVIPRLDCGIQDFSAQYYLSFVKFSILESGRFEFQPIPQSVLEFSKESPSLIIAGIAHPERFFADLKKISMQFASCETISLADHGQINHHCLKKIEQSKVIILTLKDFFRFCTNQEFLKLCSTRVVYGCYPEYELTAVL